MNTPREVIEFLSRYPQDEPLWVDIVLARDIRAYISESEYPDDAHLPIQADEIEDSIILKGMKAHDRRCNFNPENAISEISDTVAALWRERNDK